MCRQEIKHILINPSKPAKTILSHALTQNVPTYSLFCDINTPFISARFSRFEKGAEKLSHFF